ncbi:MAG: magnesium and cobalt transport protein CorA [Bacteroides sp.]|nr:magnesium and cobalt transport protein CorA [Bacteroides sp.]
MVLEFGMTSLDVRDILTPGHMVKVDNHKNKVLIIINSCSFEHDDHLSTEHIAIFVKDNLLITFTETDEPLFENVENALLSNVMNVRQQSSSILLGFILNSLLADLIDSASRMERMLEKIEDILLQNHYSQKSLGHKIQQCRHVYLIIRKNSHPLRSEFGTLLTSIKGVTAQEDMYLFEELSDQLEFIIQTTYNSESILNSLVDLYASNNDMRANVIMERLTVVATLFIPITFLVGVWGMNFDYMPELHTKYGYLLAWVAILLTVAITWGYMKRKKWF